MDNIGVSDVAEKLVSDTSLDHLWIKSSQFGQNVTFEMSLQVSETLVLSQGDFLVRQSQSSPGDFVLTCRWDQRSLHFLIRKTAIQAGETYTQVQYAVEGQGFDTIPALVHFYMGSRAVVTKHSGVQILQPVNRTLPLSYLETAFCPRLCQRDEKEKIAGVRPRR